MLKCVNVQRCKKYNKTSLLRKIFCRRQNILHKIETHFQILFISIHKQANKQTK